MNRCRKRSADARKDLVLTRVAKRTGKSCPPPKMACDTGQADWSPKAASQASDFLEKFKPENLSQKTNLRFERVNEVTFKLTDGEDINVPASHGQWGGYRTTKAVAWVIKIGADAWLARCQNQACGPSTFSEAKQNAVAMARGAVGDYLVDNPVEHLDGTPQRSCSMAMGVPHA